MSFENENKDVGMAERSSRLRIAVMAIFLLGYLTLPLWMGWFDSSQWRSDRALWDAQGTTFYVPVTLAILLFSGLVGLIGTKEHGQKTFCMLNAFAIVGLMLGLSLMN